MGRKPRGQRRAWPRQAGCGVHPRGLVAVSEKHRGAGAWAQGSPTKSPGQV